MFDERSLFLVVVVAAAAVHVVFLSKFMKKLEDRKKLHFYCLMHKPDNIKYKSFFYDLLTDN